MVEPAYVRKPVECTCPRDGSARQLTEKDRAIVAAAGPAVSAARFNLSTRMMTRCHSHADGDCVWEDCPQLRDGEPAASGRHCPLDSYSLHGIGRCMVHGYYRQGDW